MAGLKDPSPVDIRILGGFVVRVDGREVAAGNWPSLRSAQLVQRLSLAPQRRLLRDEAIECLWPQLDPEAGAANLRKAAHHVRQALGFQDALVLQGGQVLLCPSRDVCIDAARFEALARDALAGRDAAACRAAANLYGGDLLPQSQYEPWTAPERARFRARYIELLRHAGDWQRLVEAEPTDEPACRELMRRELAAGNRAAALRWYARLRSALQQELGTMPDGETEAVYQTCVAPVSARGPAFVGRAEEAAMARAWLAQPAAERNGGMVIRGPAGIGKSALSEEIARLAQRNGWSVVRVDAVQPGRPYAVVVAAVEQVLLARRDVLDAIGAPARSVLAMLTALASPAAPLQGPLGRHQIIGALRRTLVASSPGRPVLLMIDDAHLVETADADVLLQLAATGRPVHVLLSLRAPPPDSRLGRGLARLLGRKRLLLIELGPLADEEASRLVALTAPRTLSAASMARLLQLAGGNAFAAVELARSIGPDESARLPASVSEAVTARLCDVEPRVLSLLERVAVAGDEFDPAAIVALHDGLESEAFDLLDQALAAGVLTVADARYRFRHELVRQAMVEQVPPHKRLRIHRDAARRLAAVGAPPALVARHWVAGGSQSEASQWLVAAARDAMRLGAFNDVLDRLETLLLHEPAHPEGLRLRAEALEAIGDPAAVAAYRRAAEAADEVEAHNLRAKAALAQVKQGDPKGALEALVGVRPTSVDGRLAEALAYSGAAALGFGDPAIGTRKAAESRRLALETGDTASIVVASWAQAAAAHARGELHGSVWADLHETHHVPHLAVRVFDGHLCITQRFLYGARPYGEVIRFADALAEEARRLGAARGHAFGVTLRGEAELLAGDLDAAEEHLVVGGRLHRAVGGPTGEALSLQRRAELALVRGRRDAARHLLDEALDLARQTDIGFHLLDRIYGTRITLGADPDEALAALEEAQDAVRGNLETCPGCRITFAVPAAIAAARAGRLDLADRYEPAVEYLANVVMRLPAWYAALEEVRGHLALARGQGRHAAAAHFAAAARRFRDAGHPLDAVRCEAAAAAR
jgi:DNA-binding SARP family transcriptional activator/tetratricopeptide (TPR) repeat protein